MKGYWKAEAATAKAMTPDGFFRRGDVATMDADGFVFIVDRTKDMLLCGGYNVYPRGHRGGDLRAPFGRRSVRDRHSRRLPRPADGGPGCTLNICSHRSLPPALVGPRCDGESIGSVPGLNAP